MAVARVWEEEWSPSEEFGRHLELVAPAAPQTLRTGVSVSVRRAARERMLRRRRRASVLFAAVVSLVILAWPGHAFGGVTGTGVSADTSIHAALSSGMVYVIQDGDSLTSVAKKIDPAHVATVRDALVHELGSRFVVPGEHVLIP